MLDIKLIREKPEIVKSDLRKRGMDNKIGLVEKLIEDERSYLELSKKIQDMRKKRNDLTSEINKLKKAGESITDKIKEMKSLPREIKAEEENLEKLKESIDKIMSQLPNILHESVPEGKDDTENVVVRTWGKKTEPGFKLKSHVDILESLDLGDTQKAAVVAGARFFYLKKDLVMLDLALQRFALDLLSQKGFIPMEVPLMINKKAISGAITLGDFEDVIYKIEDEDLFMIATSEHSLACYHMNELIEEDGLPIKYAGISTCFRKEAGSHGKDTKGIFRVHQFNKVEQFVFSRQEDSWKVHEELIKNSEEIFQKLGLHYRIVNVCTGDIGAVAAKKYDLEAWMPVQKKYREMVSCSNCTDFQSRKLNIKYGKAGAPGKKLAHTLNSTAVATTRVMCAIIENYQDETGVIRIPEALVPYMNNKKFIGKND